MLAKEVNSNDEDYSYADYFFDKYGTCPMSVKNVTYKQEIVNLVSIYPSLSTSSDYIFYFDTADIRTFLGLETYNTNAVLIDFSTKYVYSVDGVKDPVGEYIYYSLAEMTGKKNVSENYESVVSSTVALGVSDDNDNTATLKNVGATKLLKVKLNIIRGESGRNYPIQKAYYSLDGGNNYIEVDYLGDCVYSDDEVEFVIYEPGEYTFMAKDTSGKQVKTTQTYIYK